MRLNEIYEAYKDDVQFLCVYIQEAHPEDGWQVSSNLDDDVIYNQPMTTDERAEVAQACMLKLEMKMPMVVDGMDNAVDNAYAALPERLYVIDSSGRIAYRGRPGPMGFDPEEWLLAIDSLISD